MKFNGFKTMINLTFVLKYGKFEANKVCSTQRSVLNNLTACLTTGLTNKNSKS